MIKLTLNPDSEPEIKLFHKPIVIIGSDSDLSLPGESLLPSHVKILEQGNYFIIINQANDPFVTLNGLPFGKKTLSNNDILQIGNTSIHFQGEISQTSPLPTPQSSFSVQKISTDEKLNTILERTISNLSKGIPSSLSKESEDSRFQSNLKKQDFPSQSNFQQNQQMEIDDFEDQTEEFLVKEEWNIEKMDEKDLHHLLEQVEELENYSLENERVEEGESPLSSKDNLVTSDNQTHSLHPTEASTLHPKEDLPANQKKESFDTFFAKSKNSLKDSYLSELEDENQPWNHIKSIPKNEISPSEKWDWKLISLLTLFLFILSIVLGVFFYNKMVANNAEEETKAAESIADVAMALNFAQLNHIKPQNQNWSDPEFLKNNLLAVLSDENLPLVQLDSHGQFSNISYLLRIYTSSDLSQYLIIAQPAPSLLQWFIPKDSILVHSKTMELRKISDLKAINRLLLNPITLDGMSAVELGHLVKQGEIIPLKALAQTENHEDFKPPPALAHIRPKAENLIYNAPRYYRFGERFLKKAQILANNLNNNYEFAAFQDEVLELAKYPNIVLYTSNGIHWAREAQKQMSLFLPNSKLLVATLKLNPQGIITNSKLLIDSGVSDIATAETSVSLLDEVKTNFNSNIRKTPLIEENEVNENEHPIDILNPLYSQLKALALSYNNAMLPLENEFKSLLESANIDDNIALLERLQKLLLKSEKNYQHQSKTLEKNRAALAFIQEWQKFLINYHKASQKESESLIQKLFKLYQEHENVPIAQFISYLNAAGFNSYVQEHLNHYEKTLMDNELIEAQVQELLSSIKLAYSLNELGQKVTELSAFLTLEKMPDGQKLNTFQNLVRLQVLEKLNDFLLSSEKTLSEREFIVENRASVANILKESWVVDPDEFDFYLNEFDMRIQNASIINAKYD
jgi:hypothetical protein